MLGEIVGVTIPVGVGDIVGVMVIPVEPDSLAPISSDDTFILFY